MRKKTLISGSHRSRDSDARTIMIDHDDQGYPSSRRHLRRSDFVVGISVQF